MKNTFSPNMSLRIRGSYLVRKRIGNEGPACPARGPKYPYSCPLKKYPYNLPEISPWLPSGPVSVAFVTRG